MQNERKVLVSALLKAEKNGYSNLILDHLLKETALNDAGRGFVTSAFYGVLERKITIDHILNRFLKRPIKKAPPYTAAVLRAGAYQILFMDKIPANAAVNESVKLLKHSKESGNAGLVNAVLRNVSTCGIESILAESDQPEIVYSVQPWIYRELEQAYGKQAAEAFLKDSFEIPPMFVHICTEHDNAYELFANEATALGAVIEPTDLPDCYRVYGLGAVEKLQSFQNGLFFVQDYSSQVCAAALAAKPEERILDCCAAPGGKSFSIALGMRQRGELVSSDLYEQRVGLIKKGAERLGLTHIHPTVMDATKYDPTLGLFDRVLCDAPCSGIGVIRRKPEIKYKSDQDCAELTAIQKEILQNVSRYVKPGGRLVYSTCTLLPRENEAIVTAFLKNNSDFSLVTDKDTAGMHTLMPPRDPGDGFFFAVLERKG